MSERMTAEILIGGPVDASLVARVIDKIVAQGVVVGWEEEPFCADSAAELLALAQKSEQAGLLHFVDHQATWGAFAELEAFLCRHGIAFDRSTEAKFEYEGELVQFRP